MYRIRQCIRLVSKQLIRTKSTEAIPKVEPTRNNVSLIFGKYLFWTNTLSNGVLMLVGDIVQQEIEFRQHKIPERYDYGRSTRMFLVGLSQGPLHHYFYIHLHRFFPKRNFSSIINKILVDQFIMSPICITSFFYTIGLLEFKPINKCTAELKEKYWDVYLMDWCVWPVTQFINFYFLSVKYQVLYINVVTMFYNVFLSYIKHNESDSHSPLWMHLSNKRE